MAGPSESPLSPRCGAGTPFSPAVVSPHPGREHARIIGLDDNATCILTFHSNVRRFRMGAITRISWSDATFNPWVGCLRVSTACDRCYAAALSWRYGWRDGKGHDLWDPGAAASERAQPTGAVRSAGTNARRPKVRDGASFVRAWPMSLTIKCRHHGASICGLSSARRPGSC